MEWLFNNLFLFRNRWNAVGKQDQVYLEWAKERWKIGMNHVRYDVRVEFDVVLNLWNLVKKKKWNKLHRDEVESEEESGTDCARNCKLCKLSWQLLIRDSVETPQMTWSASEFFVTRNVMCWSIFKKKLFSAPTSADSPYEIKLQLPISDEITAP